MISLIHNHFLVYTVADLTRPSLPTAVSKIRPGIHSILGVISSINHDYITNIYIRSLHPLQFQAALLKVFSSHLFQNMSARYCTCLYRLLYTSSFTNFPCITPGPFLGNNKRAVVNSSRSLGPSVILVRGLPFTMDSASKKNVSNWSSSRSCEPMTALRIFLIVLIILSHDPPIRDAPAGLYSLAAM